jgi:hypothetical protein
MWQIRDTWLPTRAIGTCREFSLFVAFRNESGQITAPRCVERDEREFSVALEAVRRWTTGAWPS